MPRHHVLLDATGVGLSLGPRALLRDVDLHLAADGRLALVGPNGSGKSTLLRVLAGLRAPDAGRVRAHGTVGLLPQPDDRAADAPGPDPGPSPATVGQLLLRRIGVAAASAAVDAWGARLTAGYLGALDGHAAALERWVALGGEDAEPRLRSAAAEVGLDPELLDRPPGTLSGGQAARAGLAALRADRHDALLLDEPTSHLDDAGLEVLSGLLRGRGGVVLVTHDRAVLDAWARDVAVLDPAAGTLALHHGGWASYVHERDVGRRRAEHEHEEALARRQAAREAATEVRRRAAAADGSTRGGGRLSDGDKHRREWVRMRAQERQGRARKMAERAERMDVPDAPRVARAPTLALDGPAARGGEVVALEAAVLRRGTFALGPLHLAVDAGERVWLRGPNGAGKSTVLAALAGELEPAVGRRFGVGPTEVARLGQARSLLLGGGPTLADVVRRATGLSESEARTALAAYGLGAEVVVRPVGELSPGERTRAELAVCGRRGARLLLLDEPSTHLDLDALEALETALRDWDGALVVATHDVRLAAELALGREVVLEA